MKYILGIDLGTSFLKFGLFDPDMELQGLAKVKVDAAGREPEIFEIRSDTFHSMLKEGINRVCQDAGCAAGDINAMGYSSQANSFLLLDDQGKPLTPLILWKDRRFPELFPGIDDLWNRESFLEVTGIGGVPSPSLCVNKLLWLRKNNPKLWCKTAKLMTISDYLVYLLTGEKVGDIGSASLLGIIDCTASDWWEEALSFLDIDRDLLPDKIRVGRRTGIVTAEAARLFGLKPNIPLFAGSLDHHMAALGAGVRNKNEIVDSTGTVMAVVAFTDEYQPADGIFMAPWDRPGSYCRMAFDNNGSSSLDAYRDQFAREYSVPELIEMAACVNSAGGLTVNPTAQNGKNRSDAFSGTSPGLSHGHYVYAIIESIAASFKNIIEKMFPEEKPSKVIAAGGGAKNRLLIDIKSRYTGIPFVPAECTEAACRGAALMARNGMETCTTN